MDVSSNACGVPTPNQWLDDKLRELGFSNSHLARLIGRSRTEVQRWVNGREQIPRHHLAEIAVQLGTPKDLELAIKLKECEDFADALARQLGRFARLVHCDLSEIASAAFDLLQKTTREECGVSADDVFAYASALLYNITHASFVFRLWSEAATSGDFERFLAPETMKLHVRYPSNHFLGLALRLGVINESTSTLRDAALVHLRTTAIRGNLTSPYQLAGCHVAVNTLARFGSASDQEMILELVKELKGSADPLSIRVGYAGLIQRPEYEVLADEYTWLLHHDESLALVDSLFEAVHYGDITPGPTLELPRKLGQLDRGLARIVRRLEHSQNASTIRKLEAFRLRYAAGNLAIPIDPRIAARLRNALSERP